MTVRIKPLVWEENGKFSLLGRGFAGYTTSIYFREDGRFKIDLRGIGVLRPTLAMAKELLEDEYQEFMAPAFEVIAPTDQLSAAMALPEVRALVDALRLMVNHAEWRENNEGIFWEATNHARNALAPFGKATE
jgi:hypothetical protein